MSPKVPMFERTMRKMEDPEPCGLHIRVKHRVVPDEWVREVPIYWADAAQAGGGLRMVGLSWGQ